jgi:hypothetical protein
MLEDDQVIPGPYHALWCVARRQADRGDDEKEATGRGRKARPILRPFINLGCLLVELLGSLSTDGFPDSFALALIDQAIVLRQLCAQNLSPVIVGGTGIVQ